MKKIIAIALAILFIGGAAAMADQTGRTFWHNHSYTDNDSYVDRWSELYEKKMEMGAMLDVIVLRETLFDIPYTVGTQGQYDANNNEWGIYGKVTVDLSGQVKDVWNSLLGR